MISDVGCPQGLMLARKALYYLSYPLALFFEIESNKLFPCAGFEQLFS
jgi:hypothetical protein